MDASPAPPPTATPAASSTNSGPSVRSRITVVCAECKRLKLRCDRRTPCGSCTKRDTVARCIYSPAAAEKVDLHSLNNRLIMVEGMLNGLTEGKFQSTYPLVQPPPPHSAIAGPSHQHHHHPAAHAEHLPGSIALPLRDVADIWLDDLDLGVPLKPHSRRASTTHTTNYIKLEPSPAEFDLPPSASLLPAPSLSPPRRTPKRPLTNAKRPSPARHLPALTIYYPAPSIPPPGSSSASSSAFPNTPSPHYPPASASSQGTGAANYTFPSTSAPPPPPPQHPQPTPDLLRLLPDLETCVRLLEMAGEVLRVRPVPVWASPAPAWPGFEKRLLRLLGTLGLTREQRDKEREIHRAKAIFSRNTEEVDLDDVEEVEADLESLPLFACLCLGVGLGALVSPSPAPSSSTGRGTHDPVYYYALAQQALGVWDTQRVALSSSFSSSGPKDREARRAKAKADTEALDYLTCCLLGMEFLTLTAEDSVEEGEDMEEEWDGEREGTGVMGGDTGREVLALVNKMQVLARQLDFSPSPSSLSASITSSHTPTTDPVPPTPSNNKKKHPKERHPRSIQLVNGGVLTDRGVGRLAKGGAEREQEQRETEKEAEREREREEVKRMVWWGVVFWDLFTSDASGYPSSTSTSSTGKRVPLPLCAQGENDTNDSYDDEEDDRDDERLETEEEFREMRLEEGGRRTRFKLLAQGREGKEGMPVGGDRERYFGVRCRLTQLTQMIKQRLAHPDCCCGYTLDQAAVLEDMVRGFGERLPAGLQFASSALSSSSSSTTRVHSSTSPPPAEEYPSAPYGYSLRVGPGPGMMDDENEHEFDTGTPVSEKEREARERTRAAQAAEVCILLQLLVIRVYGPFLRRSGNGGAGAVNHPAYHACLAASQMILRACKSLADALKPSTSHLTLSPPAPVPPALISFFPLAQTAFAALVVCAHACLMRNLPGPEVEVVLGLEVLADLGAGMGMGKMKRRVVDAIRRRVESRGGMSVLNLKRKHSQVDLSLGGMGAGAGAGMGGKELVFEFPGGVGGGGYPSGGSGGTGTGMQGDGPPPHSRPPFPAAPSSSSSATIRRKDDNASTTAGSASTTSSSRKGPTVTVRDKDKKQKTLPQHGVRMRKRDGAGTSTSSRGTSRTRTHSGGTTNAMGAPPQPTPLMTSTPRSGGGGMEMGYPSSAGGVTSSPASTTQTQQMGMMHGGYRSRSSSISQHMPQHPPPQPQQQQEPAQSMDYPMQYGPMQEHMSLHRRYSAHELGPPQQLQHPQPLHQQHQQQVSPQQQPYASPPLFDHSRNPQSRESPFDTSRVAYEQAPGIDTSSASYGGVSSPYQNSGRQVSSTSSPYGSTGSGGGHPPHADVHFGPWVGCGLTPFESANVRHWEPDDVLPA